MKQGHIFIIAGPSGVGKNSVISELVKIYPNLAQIPSYTTRPQRHDDSHHQNRITISRPEFETLIRDNQLADWAEVHGQLYGKKKSDIDRILENQNIIIEIDIQGLAPYKKQFPQVTSFFLKYRSMSDMLIRLKRTHPEMSEQEIQRRIKTAQTEMKYRQLFDHQITTYNDKPAELPAKKISNIINSLLANQPLNQI